MYFLYENLSDFSVGEIVEINENEMVTDYFFIAANLTKRA